MALDEIDIKIIRILLRDGRASYSQISKEVGLSDVAVRKRVERLLREGVIKKISAILNPKSIGYRYTLFLFIRAEPQYYEHIFYAVLRIPGCIEGHIVVGEYPLIFKCLSPSVEDMKRIIEAVSSVAGVLDIKSAVSLKSEDKEVSLPAKFLQGIL